MLGSKTTVSVLAVAALMIAAAPAAFAIKSSNDNGSSDGNGDLVTVSGEVTKFLYDDWENETDYDNDTGKGRACAFVIDNETVVEFGPWWYWMVQNVTVADIVHVGDIVNVTGELEDGDGASVLEAWHIENLTTGEQLTIKEEGRPPWAGGPKGLGIDPWPPSDEDE